LNLIINLVEITL